MLNKSILGAAVIALALGLSACGGSTTTVKQTETQGQQLMDLKAAYDSGVITEKEYNKTKGQILKGK
jgi:ABC-type glycerol-3-phosphate transport system substrate-binding protein